MSNIESKKVFVAMSGGVDSSVAAGLLKQEGYEVVGAHMKCWSQGSSDALAGVGATSCSSEQDVEDARRAAEVLNIPFYVFDFEKEYKERVVEYMVEGYRQGITPNPDVMCNKEIKFGLFLDRALSLGANYIATGHYVRLKETPTLSVGAPTPKGVGVGADYVATGHYVRLAFRYISDGTGVAPLLRRSAPTPRPEIFASQKPSISGLRSYRTKHTEKLAPTYYLLEAKDKNKDQSYFLWTLTQEQLRHCLFPIGDYLKPEVRAMARKLGLPNADKKDSQGICFLGQVTLKDFLGNYLPEKRGLVLNTSGKVIGEHAGAHFYTIGQRSGLGIGGNSRPVYIAEKDVKENAILVAEEGNEALYRKEIALRDVNFINFLMSHIRANKGYKVLARVRYRQPLAKAILHQVSSAMPTGRQVKYQVIFEKPQKFVASGQSAVFYSPKEENLPAGRQVIGGGIIV